MRPLSDLPAADRRRVLGVITDIDDTLTTDGRLTAKAFASLWALKQAGLIVVPITGRPAGWCDHIARMWPVDAVVGENGAFYFRYDAARGCLVQRFHDDAETRTDNRQRLERICRAVLSGVPGSAPASDQRYREADLAIDYREDVPPLADVDVQRIVTVFQDHGATAKVSSIHVNGWFGAYDKLSMTRTLMREVFDMDLDATRERFVFVGDSPNDEPMFAHFSNSVGVANIRRFADRMANLPAYVTEGPAGAGFAELAAALLDVRPVR